MYGSWLEEVRFKLEAIEVLEKAIVGEMLSLQDNPKEKTISEHKIHNFAAMVQEKSKDALSFLKEETAIRREELSLIDGTKSIKSNSDKKKPTDVIWQNFYERAKELKDQFRRQDASFTTSKNTVENLRNSVFQAPFKEPDFSLEESKGKYVDMHSNYLEFLNLAKLMEEEATKLHDYLWFLQNMDKFDEYSLKKKIKHQPKYLAYLLSLYNYLASFLKRSRPLFDCDEFLLGLAPLFQEKYSQGKVLGWEETQVGHIDESKTEYCQYCRKIFITNEAFVNHLNGKRHAKLSLDKDFDPNPQEEAEARLLFLKEN